MKKVILTIVLIIFVFSIFSLLNKRESNKLTIQTEKRDISFNIEFVKSPSNKATGLSKYNSIEDNYGMVFLNDSDTKISFWMKNMKFPIDIIFINSNNTIIDIHKNNQPCLYNASCPLITPTSNYRTVLEINSGLVDKYEIKVGDKVVYKTTF